MATSEQLLYGVPTWHQVTSVNNNTASTATAAAVAGKCHFVVGYTVSVSAAPSSPVSVTLKDGTTVIDQFELAAAGVVTREMTRPIRITAGNLAALSIPAVGGTTRATAVLKGFTAQP